MIRDQLAEHTADSKLHENLMLSKVVEMAFQLRSDAQLALWLAVPVPSPLLPPGKCHWTLTHTGPVATVVPHPTPRANRAALPWVRGASAAVN